MEYQVLEWQQYTSERNSISRIENNILKVWEQRLVWMSSLNMLPSWVYVTYDV